MNKQNYLDRIGFIGDITPNLNCLRRLHRDHIMNVPFEAIDVHLKSAIELNLSSLYDKIVNDERGGYCYELNYLFHSLLSNNGFDCWMISSQIFNDESYGPEYDHMSIVVQLDELWLVDVGFGDLFIEPKRIKPGIVQEDIFNNYIIEKMNNVDYLLSVSTSETGYFKKKYRFSLHEREIEEFQEQNKFKQSSPESYFVQNTICTMPTSDGRITILNDILKVRVGNQVTERKIENPKDLEMILRDEFNIRIGRAKLREIQK